MFKKFFNNTRKPVGFLGRVMLKGMNKGHTKVSLWGLEQFPNIHPTNMIELGCGGGINAARLLKLYKNAKMTAVDYSYESIRKTKRYNEKAIAEGKLVTCIADVSKLPMESDAYDLATAFETVYFWPGPKESFQEVYRILKKDGIFVIVNEVARRTKETKKWEDMIDGMTIYNKDELSLHLEEAGFVVIHTKEEDGKLCVIGKKE